MKIFTLAGQSNMQGLGIAGFYWHQGWNDATKPAFVAEYEDNFVCFAAESRKDFGVKDLPIIISRGRRQR